MNKIRQYRLTTLFVIFCLVFMGYPVSADDTCVFSVTADDMPPNIVLLLDSGAEMEQIIWHSSYDNTADYSPGGATEVLGNAPGTGNAFLNDRGYGIVIHGGSYILVDIPANLEIADYTISYPAISSDTTAKTGTWFINGRTITLPAEPSTVEVGGVIDNANYFRYSKNYLNWLFFGSYNVDGAGDGSDLPNQTRFYKAKEAIMTVASGTTDKARFGIYYFSNATGGSQAQPLAFVADENGVLTSAFINNINNMHTVTYSPLAEGLSTVGYYYSSPSSGASGGYCQSNFVIVISPGISSEDQGTPSQHVPVSLTDLDDDDAAGGITEGKIREDGTDYNIPVNQNGSTYLDDVAYYLYSHDIVGDAPSTGSLCYDTLSTGDFVVGETITGDTSGATGYVAAVNVDAGSPSSGCLELESITGTFENDETITSTNHHIALVNGSLFDSGEGYQNVQTYTVGFMGDQEGNLFLINTSNNGNGKKNLYDTSDEDYGKYHFTAQSPDALSTQLLAAVNSILSKTTTFMAPVVPVTRTTSGDKIYMAFFKPSQSNFWEGNVTKYGISSGNEIMDAHSPPEAATWPNGAMKEGALPYWATIDWADVNNTNGISNLSRTIYTVLDNSTLTSFDDNNTDLTSVPLSPSMFGNPASNTIAQIINYVRGADIFDEDGDTDFDDNRSLITGDVLHSEPLIFQYKYSDDTYTTVVYFGANDGMLHAVLDEDNHIGGLTPGSEMWGFIPPDQLPRLKDMIEGTGHQVYVDSTPKIYFKDDNGNGIVETSGGNNDQVILICGERGGGTSYFALDVTRPFLPTFLWRVNQTNDTGIGWDPPTTVISELGETWSEPQFGLVKDGVTDTPVLFVGGGYSSDNSSGKAVIAINVTDGSVVKKFTTGMNYAIPSNVLVVDEDDNGYVDKVYVGDLGGQMWRIGKFTDSGGNPLTFPNSNEDITTWTAQVFFQTDSTNSRKFFYPPSLTLEIGFDMVFGDREDACNDASTPADILAGVKDIHSSTPLVADVAADLVLDVTDPAAPTPDLSAENGWYIRLVDNSGSPVGEKVLAEGVVFYKVFYITTFTPNDDACVPGGNGKLYALSYLTGQPVMDFTHDGNNDRSVTIGGGIPSKPVMLITKTGTRLLISVGSSNADESSESTSAGVLNITPVLPPINFFYKYWREF